MTNTSLSRFCLLLCHFSGSMGNFLMYGTVHDTRRYMYLGTVHCMAAVYVRRIPFIMKIENTVCDVKYKWIRNGP